MGTGRVEDRIEKNKCFYQLRGVRSLRAPPAVSVPPQCLFESARQEH